MGTSGWPPQVAAFAEKSVTCDDAAELTAAFRGLLSGYGLNGFACGEVDLGDWRRTVFIAVEWPGDWLSFYAEEGLAKFDPVVSTLLRCRSPFTWADVQAESMRTRAAWRAFEAARDFGWREGLVIPLPRGGTRRGLISLHGDREPLAEAQRSALTVASVLYYERLRGLVAGQARPQNTAGLTPRELHCLAFVASGHNDADIGEKLGIAQSTAHEHVERAKRRLGVRTRAEAVAIAVSLGLIVV